MNSYSMSSQSLIRSNLSYLSLHFVTGVTLGNLVATSTPFFLFFLPILYGGGAGGLLAGG